MKKRKKKQMKKRSTGGGGAIYEMGMLAQAAMSMRYGDRLAIKRKLEYMLLVGKLGPKVGKAVRDCLRQVNDLLGEGLEQ